MNDQEHVHLTVHFGGRYLFGRPPLPHKFGFSFKENLKFSSVTRQLNISSLAGKIILSFSKGKCVVKMRKN